MNNKVQLITYAERLGGNCLATLDACLSAELKAVFLGGVHILPFYESIHGSDAGFDPKDHTMVDRGLGQWDDVARIGQHTPIMADVIVNHMSRHSEQFLDFEKKGDTSEFATLFLTRDKVFPKGISAAELALIYRPRPTSPFHPIPIAAGLPKHFWTTFTSEQIDIDVESPAGLAYLRSIFKNLANAGVSMARLDAVGYAIKRAGTSCFMLPETFAFIDRISSLAKDLGIEVLVEVHSHYQTQIDIAKRVDRVYDFALPPLMLHTLFSANADALMHWIGIRPSNCVTVLDTHDGIGIIDIGADKISGQPGLVSPQELDALVEQIHTNSQGTSRLATGNAASNLDLYQVNCTYFDALGRDEWAYLQARAVQFFLPGVPQVYYVGLLAGRNDMALLEKTKVGRDINRSYFDGMQVRQQLQKGVVQRLLALIELRNSHPAFDGEFKATQLSEAHVQLRWALGEQRVSYELNLAERTARLWVSDAQGRLSEVGERYFGAHRHIEAVGAI
jgi:sucrose phosphorylase